MYLLVPECVEEAARTVWPGAAVVYWSRPLEDQVLGGRLEGELRLVNGNRIIKSSLECAYTELSSEHGVALARKAIETCPTKSVYPGWDLV